MEKPSGLANYLCHNLERKNEICYIFRVRAGTTSSLATLFGRGKLDLLTVNFVLSLEET